MKVTDIQSVEDMQNYCEGIINDLQEGIIDRNEAFHLFGEYTNHIVDLAYNKGLKDGSGMYHSGLQP